MPDDRRSVRRARLSGAQATYESASGAKLEADVLDLGKGGLFLQSAAPLPVGKRLSLEIRVAGEPSAWSALGRIVWTRAKSEGADRPAGMGVKLIDVDDAILLAIERLVDSREPTDRGIIAPSPSPSPPRPRAPQREGTVLGIGLATATEAPGPVVAAPVSVGRIVNIGGAGSVIAPAREAVVPQVILPDDPADRELSVPIELVSKKPPSNPAPPLAVAPRVEEPVPVAEAPIEEAPRAAEEQPRAVEEAPRAAEGPASEPSRARAAEPEAPPPVKKRSRGGVWLLLVLALAGAVAVGLTHRDRIRHAWLEWRPR